MWKTILAVLVGSILAGPSQVRADAPPPPPRAETPAVRSGGLDFQLLAPTTWPIPTDEKGTPLPLSLKVTNPGEHEFQFDLDGSLTITLKDSTGKELPMASGIDGLAKRQLPALIAKAQSISLDRPAQLRNANDKDHTLWLAGQMGLAFWRFDGLKLGQYTLAMTYENTNAGPKNALAWFGKVTTKELTIEITDKPAATRAANDPAGPQLALQAPVVLQVQKLTAKQAGTVASFGPNGQTTHADIAKITHILKNEGPDKSLADGGQINIWPGKNGDALPDGESTVYLLPKPNQLGPCDYTFVAVKPH